MNWIRRYARWLHTGWPAGTVEPFPRVGEDGRTNVPGVYVTGDLTGVPLLKFALDRGVRTLRAIAADPGLRTRAAPGVLDVAILGAGVSGMAAALEAQRLGLAFEVVEAAEPFFTLMNFPRRKPIFTYPNAMTPAGALQVSADVKEALVDELRAQVARAQVRVTSGRAERVARAGGHLVVALDDGRRIAARRVVIAVGRTGEFRRLGIPGEDLDRVANRLHDPHDYAARRVVVVGGGDAAAETALALAAAGAHVDLIHRGVTLARPKPELRDALAALAGPRAPDRGAAERARAAADTARVPAPEGAPPPQPIALHLETTVREITPAGVRIARHGVEQELACDAVFVMIGREPPLDLLRRSGVAIAHAPTPLRGAALVGFVAFCAWLYDWKSGGAMTQLWEARHWFPTNLPDLLAAAGAGIATAARDPRTPLGTLAISAAAPAFWYTLVYSLVVVGFGVRRIRRRRTPYITAQTLSLMAFQVVPLFLLPEFVLPLLGHRGLLPAGLADALFPVAHYGHGREYWRAYGLVLAWPLDVYNVFTHQPLGAWLAISAVQTLVLIPLGVWWFGKGAYCGWICSCGALAETLGDDHRDKMPHGPGWNRLNMAGQGVLAIAVVLLAVRIAGWLLPAGNALDAAFEPLFRTPYTWAIDVFLAGVVGSGLYFWYSGRVWCRFFCPLAALMHVYARFSRFRIVADKKKCISCGQCTAVCHQGIDVMAFANQGAPMTDPECVRCSACVHVCPTGVLSFGRAGRPGQLIALDSLLASPVQMREGTSAARAPTGRTGSRH